jgi:hypothetical protein
MLPRLVSNCWLKQFSCFSLTSNWDDRFMPPCPTKTVLYSATMVGLHH